uniref:GatB_Yqey domain-containing protein n=1 Tax=Mesocestoides corti TaxID=53468 RepID=A0A5K3FYB8_MESCO
MPTEAKILEQLESIVNDKNSRATAKDLLNMYKGDNEALRIVRRYLIKKLGQVPQN